ncbi:flagellar assembly protein A [Massilia sp. ST3]|uniref:flagellar assembly protein A n=1 Tax=Massilia sp. ST3 TaxID=2824903 RepID=UPI0035A39E67
MIEPAAHPPAPASRLAGTGPEHCIVKRADGVYADPQVLGTTLVAAVDNILLADNYFAGLDYPVLIKALYGHGPELPRDARGQALVRIADDIVPFSPERRALYRAVKIADGEAGYYFEPVFLSDADGVETPTRLDVDEFIADMWMKGIRFGIDVAALTEAIATGAAGRIAVARRLDPRPGIDARVTEVSSLHRSDAPRQLANGKLDLMSFQNRFPQIRLGERLLQKLPREAGEPGFDLSGIPLAPEIPKDLDLGSYAGPGTKVEQHADGEFLVAQQDGFLSVDPKSSRIAVDDKIVSHDGVSAKTTGNLNLSGDYEEFGEVQEQRILEGEGITVHADVFGHVVSRGGAILLNRNLVGGSARNAAGPITVQGVASQSVVQTANGEVRMARAENCIISGTRVVVEQAINCEILAEEVEVGIAEGCAIGGRKLSIGRAGPRRQSEMLVFVLRPDCSRYTEAMAQVRERVGQFGELASRHRAEIEALGARPDLRKYLQLAPRIRKGELVLSAEQQPQFERLSQAVLPALRELGRLNHELKAAETEQQGGMAFLAQLEAQRSARAGAASVTIEQLDGDVQVRALAYEPDAGSVHDLPAREVKARLRESVGAELLFAGSSGEVRWDHTSGAAAA